MFFLFPKSKLPPVTGIKKKTLKLILECAKSSYPEEFCAVLRYDKKTGLITEILPLPGSLSSEKSAILHLHMLPIDFTIVGVVHSHPSKSFYPSEEDLFLFSKFGHTHIIVCHPFDEKSWAAFDFYGNRISLEVVE